MGENPTEDMMDKAKPLPGYLVSRYNGWKATTYQDNKAWYRSLANNGQHPRAMIISCCDSRQHVTSIFGADGRVLHPSQHRGPCAAL